MMQGKIPDGEIAVLGLAKSGSAVSRLLLQHGHTVYASDGQISPQLVEAAVSLRALGADVDIGAHDLARIARASLVVLSPGIDPSARPVAAARDARVRIVSELEIALTFLSSSNVIAITGTNGKTTTTALTGHLLRGFSLDAVDAGNIGTPLSEIAMRETHPSWIALEMSSFQLHDTPGLSPAVGVLTNLTPDHLDRYPTATEYFADKARLFCNANAASRWVINADDSRVLGMAKGIAGTHYTFSTRSNAHATLAQDEYLSVFGEKVIARAEFNLLGDHNVANALAAILAVSVADETFRGEAARSTMAKALRTFNPLAHRLEMVGEYDGVQWINDSKATNVSSTLVAIEGMRRPTVLLLGGRHKGESYGSLATAVRRNVTSIIAYGEAAPLIAQDLGGAIRITEMGSDFEAVMARAHELAKPGDAVLLSPACSSYDMFRNYEERGLRFRQLATSKA